MSMTSHTRGGGTPAPLAPGRGLWRLTLHHRAFVAGTSLDDTLIAEIVRARTLRVEKQVNKPAQLTFTLDGLSPSAGLIHELQTDVVAWRWDEQQGRDVAVVRGIVTQSQDTISEQVDTVQFTCHDYLAMLNRRLLREKTTYTQLDQDEIAANLINAGRYVTGFDPGSYLPIVPTLVDPAGADRAAAGVLRDRDYEASQDIAEALDNLANVQNMETEGRNFNYDVAPDGPEGDDLLRIFYPYQGTLRTDLVLEYGGSVRALSRSINSGNYANFVRAIGASSNPDVVDSPPLFSEISNPDANDVTRAPVGLWMQGDNASDVKLQSTLDEKAAGDLALAGVLLPTYSVELRWGWYRWGHPEMGDVVRLIIRAGRLNVATEVEVVAFTYEYSTDGEENVSLGLGRPDVNFGDLLTAQVRDVNALARR
jgi:hypothetical protein